MKTVKRFKKNQKVRLAVNIGGTTIYEEAVVCKVDKRGVWLERGDGNRPSGPFDVDTGIREMFCGSQVISEKL